MPQFFYKARDPKGKLITGEMEGPTRSDIASQIGGMGYTPVLIQAANRKNHTHLNKNQRSHGLWEGKFVNFFR